MPVEAPEHALLTHERERSRQRRPADDKRDQQEAPHEPAELRFGDFHRLAYFGSRLRVDDISVPRCVANTVEQPAESPIAVLSFARAVRINVAPTPAARF